MTYVEITCGECGARSHQVKEASVWNCAHCSSVVGRQWKTGR